MRHRLLPFAVSFIAAFTACTPGNDLDTAEGEGEGEGEAVVDICDNVPSFECTVEGGTLQEIEDYCGELVVFDPRVGHGYDDYPINGETADDQYRSYIRRDVAMLVTYASTRVRCTAEAKGWDFGSNILGLGDMSEADGNIPGTRERQPGHPPECHERGYDMDIAYYQLGQENNYLREVCPHTTGFNDEYHCTGEPTTLDAHRTALFIAYAMESPQYLTIAVDGKVMPLVKAAAQEMCDDGTLDLASKACGDDGIIYGPQNGFGRGISYDLTEAQDIGWFFFHHHHFHLSIIDKLGNILPNW